MGNVSLVIDTVFFKYLKNLNLWGGKFFFSECWEVMGEELGSVLKTSGKSMGSSRVR